MRIQTCILCFSILVKTMIPKYIVKSCNSAFLAKILRLMYVHIQNLELKKECLIKLKKTFLLCQNKLGPTI